MIHNNYVKLSLTTKRRFILIQKVSSIQPFPVRMPFELRNWYEQEAQENCRALNFVIVEALTKHKNETIKNREEIENANI